MTVLALYMAEQSLPLPTFEEVLVCTPSTTYEEVCPLIEHTEVKCGFKSQFFFNYSDVLDCRTLSCINPLNTIGIYIHLIFTSRERK